MKHLYKVAFAAVLLLMASCTKTEKFADLVQVPEAGVFGIIEPVTSDDPETKATFSPDMKFGFSLCDHINIWSQSGTLLIYSVDRLTAGGGAVSEGDFHYLYSVSAGGNETEPVLDVIGEW